MKKTSLSILILVILATSILVAFSSCQEKSDADIILYADNERIVEIGEYINIYDKITDKKTITFNIDNNTSMDVEIRIYTENGVGLNFEATANSENTYEYEVEGKICNAVVYHDRAYVLSGNALENAVADGYNCMLLSDIEIDNIIFKSLVEIDTAEYLLKVNESIGIRTQKSGTFTLKGNVYAGYLYAEAPKAKLIIPEKIIPDIPEMSISAISINGNPISNGFVVENFDQIKLLVTEEFLSKIESEDTIIAKNFDIEEDIIITYPVNIQFENIGGNGKIIFNTEKEGSIVIQGIDEERISINAPNCNLELGDYTVFEISSKYTVKSYYDIDISAFYSQTDFAESYEIDFKTSLGNEIEFVGYSNRIIGNPNGIYAPSTLKSVTINSIIKGYEIEIPDFCKGENNTIDLLSKYGAAIIIKKGNEYQYVEIEVKSSTQLPVVEINTQNNALIESKEEWIKASISIGCEYCTEYSFESLDFTSCEISGRGNSTWDWSFKKPYKIKLDSKESVLGMEESRNWVLLANYNDKSLIRNYVALECAKILDKCDSYATQFPVDVFLNGEYIGVYTIGEKVEAGKGRAYISEKSYSVDLGYILELNGSEDSTDEGTFRVPGLGPVTVNYPSLSIITDKQLTYIENYMTLLSRAIERKRGYEDYLDVDSLIDWYIMTEFSYNSDSCMRRSVFFEKDSGGKIRMGQPWDFDLAFGNSRADGDYSQWASLVDNNYVRTNWMTYLMEDEAFCEKLKTRWDEIKDSLYDTAINSVNTAERLVAPSQKYNFEKWDILNMMLSMEPWYVNENTTWKDQVEYLRSFIITRWNWMDETIKGM